MRELRAPLLRTLATALLAVAAAPLRAQVPAAAPAAAAPPAASPAPLPAATPRVAVENPRLRVLTIRYAPGQGTAMHEHPARVVVALTNATIETTEADGTTRTVALKKGTVSFQPPTRHAVRNVGAADARLVEIELLAAPRGNAPPAEVAGTTGLRNDFVTTTSLQLPPGGRAEPPAAEQVLVVLLGDREGDVAIVGPRSAPLVNDGRRLLVAIVVEPRTFPPS